MVAVVVGKDYTTDSRHVDTVGKQRPDHKIRFDTCINEEAARPVAEVGAVAARAAAERHEINIVVGIYGGHIVDNRSRFRSGK